MKFGQLGGGEVLNCDYCAHGCLDTCVDVPETGQM